MKESWLFPKNGKEAVIAQKEMAESIVLKHTLTCNPKTIGGVDVSNTPFDPQKLIFGAIALIDYPSLSSIGSAAKAAVQPFPYISGLLGFREAPLLVQMYQELAVKPDLLLVDGHGISHPRKLGIASHLGVLLDIPTIGVAKSILVGALEGALGEEPGSLAPLLWKGEQIGMAVRTKRRCSPVFVSAGHKVTLEYAVELVLSCLKGYKLPEPTRQAHLTAGAFRKQHLVQ